MHIFHEERLHDSHRLLYVNKPAGRLEGLSRHLHLNGARQIFRIVAFIQVEVSTLHVGGAADGLLCWRERAVTGCASKSLQHTVALSGNCFAMPREIRATRLVFSTLCDVPSLITNVSCFVPCKLTTRSSGNMSWDVNLTCAEET